MTLSIFPCGAYLDENSVMKASYNHLLTASKEEIKLWNLALAPKVSFQGLNTQKPAYSVRDQRAVANFEQATYFDIFHGLFLVLDVPSKDLLVFKTQRSNENPLLHGVPLIHQREIAVTERASGLLSVVERVDKLSLELRILVVDDNELKVFRSAIKIDPSLTVKCNEVPRPMIFDSVPEPRADVAKKMCEPMGTQQKVLKRRVAGKVQEEAKTG
ncbi:MAG: hypothetical protein P4M11_09380 [Candidatus Pacebacteria bacterium]|nr:hypothetical protein [Candidatus Paceibacterota bacterium]